MLHLGSWIVFISLVMGLPSWGQDKIDPRLKIFQEDQQEKLKFDQQREAAKLQHAREKLQQEQSYHKALKDYVAKKSQTVNSINSTVMTPEYQDWLKERLAELRQYDALRQKYSQAKAQLKLHEGPLSTTLKEYGLDQTPPRVLWSQRRFGVSGAGGTSSFSSPGFVPPIQQSMPSFNNNNNNNNENIPPPDYFEPDILPPPPDFDGTGLPPPEFFDPPPVYEGGSNFDPGLGQ